MSNGPSPHRLYPLTNQTRLVYLKNIVKNPNIVVGDYTYYDDFENPENFERNVFITLTSTVTSSLLVLLDCL